MQAAKWGNGLAFRFDRNILLCVASGVVNPFRVGSV